MARLFAWIIICRRPLEFLVLLVLSYHMLLVCQRFFFFLSFFLSVKTMKRLLRLAQIFQAPTLRNRRLYSQHVVSPHISRKSPRVGIYFIALLALASTAFYAGSQSRPIAGAASQQATVTKQKPLYASRAELEKVRQNIKKALTETY